MRQTATHGNHMNLNEEQKQTVSKWIGQGLKVSEVQKKLADELGVHLTYMDVRLLIDDLRLTPKDQTPSKDKTVPTAGPPLVGQTPDTRTPPAAARPPAAKGGPGGGVSVSLDHVTRPGAMVSGHVTFSDGNSAEWYLDQFGRLGLSPKPEGYRPSQQDLVAFQSELQKELQRAGF